MELKDAVIVLSEYFDTEVSENEVKEIKELKDNQGEFVSDVSNYFEYDNDKYLLTLNSDVDFKEFSENLEAIAIHYFGLIDKDGKKYNLHELYEDYGLKDEMPNYIKQSEYEDYQRDADVNDLASRIYEELYDDKRKNYQEAIIKYMIDFLVMDEEDAYNHDLTSEANAESIIKSVKDIYGGGDSYKTSSEFDELLYLSFDNGMQSSFYLDELIEEDDNYGFWIDKVLDWERFIQKNDNKFDSDGTISEDLGIEYVEIDGAEEDVYIYQINV